MQRPSFDQLPVDKSEESFPLNAWGLYGKDDQLGTLNMLTADRVRDAAVQCIKTGQRISLDLPLDFFVKPAFGRLAFEHKVVSKEPRMVNDDILTFNTQSSSQWDGLRHFGHAGCKKWYGGRSRDVVMSESLLGTDQWAKKGGIAGRAVLLDFASYASRHGLRLDHFSASRAITVADLEAVAKEQGTIFQPADIMIVRTGFVAAYLSRDKASIAAWHSVGSYSSIGVESSKEMLEWIWNRQFAAVAGDQPAFELWPPQSTDFFLHENLLAGWGCPIGELWNLETLAEACANAKRYEFFFTSAPLVVPGGVASPPNAIAIL